MQNKLIINISVKASLKGSKTLPQCTVKKHKVKSIKHVYYDDVGSSKILMPKFKH